MTSFVLSVPNSYMVFGHFQNFKIQKILLFLRENHDFADVTLVCEEGQNMKAKYFLLTSSKTYSALTLPNSYNSKKYGYLVYITTLFTFCNCGKSRGNYCSLPQYFHNFISGHYKSICDIKHIFIA